MIDEPVQNACGSFRKLNSTVDHRIHSSAQVLRCSAIIARAKANSRAKSRSLDASRLLATTPSKPSAWATWRGRSGGGAGQGRRAQRKLIGAAAAVGQPIAVALELFAIGQPVVRGEHRLGPLQVRVAGQNDAGVALAAADERPLQVERAGRRCGRSRRGPTAAGRSKPGRCGCGPCAACGRRRRAGRSGPARCACGCLPAPGGRRTGRRRSPGRWLPGRRRFGRLRRQ